MQGPAGNPLKDELLKEYGEIGSNFRTLTDIRFKLLGVLPLATALTSASLTRGPLEVWSFILCLFGLLITIALAIYSARNDQLYDDLVARGASIERSLGLQDGQFACRPRSWQKYGIGFFRLSVDHRSAIRLIYGASCGLWLVGVLAPLLRAFRPLAFWQMGVSFQQWSEDSIALISASAMSAAIVAASAGAIRLHREKTSDLRMKNAFDAVHAAIDQSMRHVSENTELLRLCARLSGLAFGIVVARADAYSRLEQTPSALARYISDGDPIWIASQKIALLTDASPRWLFDCAVNRSGESDPRSAERRVA